MIGHLAGTVHAIRLPSHTSPGFVIVSAGGVGYKIYATRDTLATLVRDAHAALWTHLAVREDALDLYGFPDEATLQFFALLLTVSGIGPRSALGILDIADVETLRAAIAAGESSYLTKVSGIGKKTAAKIVLELREKVGAAPEGAAEAMRGDEEALEALHALGYTIHESRDALRKVPPDIEKSSERLREALKILGSR